MYGGQKCPKLNCSGRTLKGSGVNPVEIDGGDGFGTTGAPEAVLPDTPPAQPDKAIDNNPTKTNSVLIDKSQPHRSFERLFTQAISKPAIQRCNISGIQLQAETIDGHSALSPDLSNHFHAKVHSLLSQGKLIRKKCQLASNPDHETTRLFKFLHGGAI